jgi:hypothetical protein
MAAAFPFTTDYLLDTGVRLVDINGVGLVDLVKHHINRNSSPPRLSLSG